MLYSNISFSIFIMTSFTQWHSSWNQQEEVSYFINRDLIWTKSKHCHFFREKARLELLVTWMVLNGKNKYLHTGKYIHSLYGLVSDLEWLSIILAKFFQKRYVYEQKYTTRRSFLQYLNSDFLFYLGWSGSLSTKQAKYNEGCSKLNYLLVEV